MIGQWQAMPVEKKILNLAAELSRAKNWIAREDSAAARQCLERALELADWTVEAEAVKSRPSFIREFLRFREMLAGFYAEPALDDKELFLLFQNLLNLNPATQSLQLEF